MKRWLLVAVFLSACSHDAPEKTVTEIPAQWRHLGITENGRTAIEPGTDENGLHLHYEKWSYGALLDSVTSSLESAGYVQTHRDSRGTFFGFEKGGDRLALKIDGGDGDLFVDIFNGKGGGSDSTMHRMAFEEVAMSRVVVRSGDGVTFSRYEEAPNGAQPPEEDEPMGLRTAFNAEEIRFVTTPGTASVSGRAALRLADGKLKDCAGFNVELLPVAGYSSERIRLTYGSNRQGQILLEQHPPKFAPDVPQYHEMLLKSKCDTKGAFHFGQVPAGDYYVMAFIIWDEGKTKTGGAAMKRIHVADGEQLTIEP